MPHMQPISLKLSGLTTSVSTFKTDTVQSVPSTLQLNNLSKVKMASPNSQERNTSTICKLHSWRTGSNNLVSSWTHSWRILSSKAPSLFLFTLRNIVVAMDLSLPLNNCAYSWVVTLHHRLNLPSFQKEHSKKPMPHRPSVVVIKTRTQTTKSNQLPVSCQ